MFSSVFWDVLGCVYGFLHKIVFPVSRTTFIAPMRMVVLSWFPYRASKQDFTRVGGNWSIHPVNPMILSLSNLKCCDSPHNTLAKLCKKRKTLVDKTCTNMTQTCFYRCFLRFCVFPGFSWCSAFLRSSHTTCPHIS